MATATTKSCLVIAPIGKPNSRTRRRSDQLFEHVLKPSLVARGYRPARADHIAEPGIITDQIVSRLVNDDLVVADLTEHNPNVFYELAIRHVVAKPLLQIIQAGEPVPFNVAATRVIEIDHRDLDDVKSAKKKISAQIVAIESRAEKMTSPASGVLSALLRRENDKFHMPDWAPFQVHHVSLPVRNVARSRRFYRDVVGLRELERPKHFRFGGAWFALPNGQQLHILKNDSGTFRTDAKQADYRDCHFALRVRDYREASEHFKAKGHPLVEIPTLKKRYVGGYLVDPDGHVIEINTGNYGEILPPFVD